MHDSESVQRGAESRAIAGDPRGPQSSGIESQTNPANRGRPKDNDKTLTLEPVKSYLKSLLNENIKLCELDNISDDKIIMLENIRFHQEETKNIDTTQEFRNKLTNLCDVYVNDAFGCCHRAHSSIVVLEGYISYSLESVTFSLFISCLVVFL